MLRCTPTGVCSLAEAHPPLPAYLLFCAACGSGCGRTLSQACPAPRSSTTAGGHSAAVPLQYQEESELAAAWCCAVHTIMCKLCADVQLAFSQCFLCGCRGSGRRGRPPPQHLARPNGCAPLCVAACLWHWASGRHGRRRPRTPRCRWAPASRLRPGKSTTSAASAAQVGFFCLQLLRLLKQVVEKVVAAAWSICMRQSSPGAQGRS